MGTATADVKPRRIDLRSEIHQCFHEAYHDTNRWLVLYGGSDSGKSWFAGQKCLLRTMQDKRSRIICTRKVASTIKNSVFLLLLDILDLWDIRHKFKVNMADKALMYKHNGNQIITVGLDDVEKMKSIQKPTSFWHEETTELSARDLIQLNLRLRGEAETYFQHILTFNPISRTHWLKKRFFDTTHDNATVIKTTYRDNEHLGQEDVAELDELQQQDAEMYNIYGLGLWGALEGLIYKPFIVAPYPEQFEETVYGIDFGYRAPLVVVQYGIADRQVYLKELLYKTKMTSGDFLEWLEGSGIPKRACIYADSAHPGRIAEIAQAGWNVYPAYKGQGSVHDGIMFCRSLNIHTCPENVNLNGENEAYKWRVNKDGEAIDEPVKWMDHGMDAMRYALYTHYKPEPPDNSYEQVVIVDTIAQMGGPIGAFEGM